MAGEAGREGVEGGFVVLRLDDFARLVGTVGLGGDDLGGRDGAPFGDGLGACAPLIARGAAARRTVGG